MKASAQFVEKVREAAKRINTYRYYFETEREYVFRIWITLCDMAPGGRDPSNGNWHLYNMAYKQEDLDDDDIFTAVKSALKGL